MFCLFVKEKTPTHPVLNQQYQAEWNSLNLMQITHLFCFLLF